MRFAACLLALLMLGGCGHFLEPSAHHVSYLEQMKQLAVSAHDKNKVCKRMTVTGSNMPQRVCSTPEEWAAYDKKNLEDSAVIDQERRGSGS